MAIAAETFSKVMKVITADAESDNGIVLLTLLHMRNKCYLSELTIPQKQMLEKVINEIDTTIDLIIDKADEEGRLS
jgi:hypothetical protein